MCVPCLFLVCVLCLFPLFVPSQFFSCVMCPFFNLSVRRGRRYSRLHFFVSISRISSTRLSIWSSLSRIISRLLLAASSPASSPPKVQTCKVLTTTYPHRLLPLNSNRLYYNSRMIYVLGLFPFQWLIYSQQMTLHFTSRELLRIERDVVGPTPLPSVCQTIQ